MVDRVRPAGFDFSNRQHLSAAQRMDAEELAALEGHEDDPTVSDADYVQPEDDGLLLHLMHQQERDGGTKATTKAREIFDHREMVKALTTNDLVFKHKNIDQVINALDTLDKEDLPNPSENQDSPAILKQAASILQGHIKAIQGEGDAVKGDILSSAVRRNLEKILAPEILDYLKALEDDTNKSELQKASNTVFDYIEGTIRPF